MNLRSVAIVIAMGISTFVAHAVVAAEWQKLLEQVTGGTKASPSSMAGSALGSDEIVAGLKEALANGAERAVASLGQRDGFLRNAAVKIPMPERLSKVESLLRTVGQGRYADEFVETMNRAAESAVPEAAPILGDAIRNMSIDEGRRILNGPDDAATQYFRKVGEERLSARLRPLVEAATSRAGVTSAYKSALERAGPAAALLDTHSLDIDGYVTDKTLDGLFAVIAAEERRIRENPAARSTDLLKKVFGGG